VDENSEEKKSEEVPREEEHKVEAAAEENNDEKKPEQVPEKKEEEKKPKETKESEEREEDKKPEQEPEESEKKEEEKKPEQEGKVEDDKKLEQEPKESEKKGEEEKKPVACDDASKTEEKLKEEAEKKASEENKPFVCILAHRSKSVVLSKSYPRIMGVPFVLMCTKKTTGAELYREAWSRCLRIFLRKNKNEAHIDHIQMPTEELLKSNEAEGEQKGEEKTQQRPLLHEEHIADCNGSCEYPFQLAITESSYFACPLCPVKKKCVGCVIPCNDEIPAWNELIAKGKYVYIAVDWCHECMKENEYLETNTTIVNRDESVKELRAMKSKKYTLEDCLEGFLREERLDKDEEWYCSSCKEHKRAIKKIDIWKLPRILIIHLKRFCFTSTVPSKLTTELDLPPNGELCMRPFKIGPDDGNQELYRLYAVSNHSGGVSFGHYTAHCYNQTSGKWYLFNDELTRPVNYTDLDGSKAYILFFERVPKSGSTPQ